MDKNRYAFKLKQKRRFRCSICKKEYPRCWDKFNLKTRQMEEGLFKHLRIVEKKKVVKPLVESWYMGAWYNNHTGIKVEE